jgi:hypothetical protein
MFECNYVIPEGIVSRSNQDGTVILMKMDESNTFFKINGVAAIVWRELATQKDINQIVLETIESYDAPKEKIISDIKAFVETLLAKDLVQKV